LEYTTASARRYNHGPRPIRRSRVAPERSATITDIYIYIYISPRRAPTDHHQTARTELSINPLTWDTNLSNNAQNYANQLASQDSGLDPDSQKTQGENLAYCSGSWTNPLTESTELWYAEKEDWTGDDDVAHIQDKEVVGHYTQVM
jgi:hypothetical protein